MFGNTVDVDSSSTATLRSPTVEEGFGVLTTGLLGSLLTGLEGWKTMVFRASQAAFEISGSRRAALRAKFLSGSRLAVLPRSLSNLQASSRASRSRLWRAA